MGTLDKQARRLAAVEERSRSARRENVIEDFRRFTVSEATAICRIKYRDDEPAPAGAEQREAYHKLHKLLEEGLEVFSEEELLGLVKDTAKDKRMAVQTELERLQRRTQ